MAKRLTESQKTELVEGYRQGMTSSSLARKFDCSANTINRIVKAMMPKDEYLLLKESRFNNKSVKVSENINNKRKVDQLLIHGESTQVEKLSDLSDADRFSSVDDSIEKVNDESIDFNINENKSLALDDASDFMDDSINEAELLDNVDVDFVKIETNHFQELAPLISDFGFENEKQKVSTELLGPNILPQVVYLLVSQKVELDPKPLKEFSEWAFLPEEEKELQAILLFESQRAAKRNCNRGQRVIKVPNSDVFVLTKPFLLSKGITRLVLDDVLIALDK